MIDVRKLAAEAAKGFGLSLKDDPTAWGAADGDSIAAFSALDIVDNCHAEAKRCAASGVASVLGRASEGIATAMDVAIYEDGPLADLDAVWAQHVIGLSVDLTGVAAAKDWQGRVDALREAIARAAPSVSAAIPAPEIADVLAYAESDYRLREAPALMAELARLGGDDDFKPPAFVAKAFPQEAAPADTWDDEPGAPAPVETSWDDELAPVEKPKRRKPNNSGPHPTPASKVPNFLTGLLAAGVTKADVARLLGFSDSYIGYIAAGKKPWPGLRPDQVEALRADLTIRRDALNEALAVAEGRDLLLPAGS